MEIRDRNDVREKQESSKENDGILHAELGKNNDTVANAMNLMATREIDTIDFSNDERTNTEYMNRFKKAEDDLAYETREILSGK